MESVVNFREVSKVFKQKKAVDHVSFSINKGDTVAILGPNGAGKTTTLMMMLGLMKATFGKVELFQRSATDQEIRERIGVMLQEVSIIDALKVHEVLKLFRSYYKKPLPFEDLVSITGLEPKLMNKMANKLSGGQKRRLNFALALAGNPDILFLDEPTVGMDISSRKQFWETIDRLKKQGKTIIFTTHYLQEADEIANRIILFANGNVIADGTPQSIKANLTKKSVSFDMNAAISIEELEQYEIFSNVYIKNDRVFISTEDTDEVLNLLYQIQLPLKNVSIEHGKLEEAFELLTAPKEDM